MERLARVFLFVTKLVFCHSSRQQGHDVVELEEFVEMQSTTVDQMLTISKDNGRTNTLWVSENVFDIP